MKDLVMRLRSTSVRPLHAEAADHIEIVEGQIEAVRVIAIECACCDPNCDCDWCKVSEDLLAAIGSKL